MRVRLTPEQQRADADARHGPAGRVAQRHAVADDTGFIFLVVHGVATAARFVQHGAQGRQAGDGAGHARGQRQAAEQALKGGLIQGRQIRFADRAGMQGHRRADARHHAHRAGAFQLVDIDHFAAGGHRQVHGFAGLVAQRLQLGRQRGPQVELRPGSTGQRHQARPQAIEPAGFVDHALLGQRRHDAVDGGTRIAASAREQRGRGRLGRVGHGLQHRHEFRERRGARDLGFQQVRPQIKTHA
ncbi:hypothetical protein D3C72_908770 [compost metagenome]